MSDLGFCTYKPPAVRRVLNQLGIHPSKRRGQSFLVSEKIAGRIVERASLNSSDTVLEIGPGLGALTCELVRRAGRVIAIESDGRLVSWLRDQFAKQKNLEIMHANALAVDLQRVLKGRVGEGARVKVVSNIPYSISTPLIAKLITEFPGGSLFILTLQRELAERITASPGGKDYGAFTVFCRYHSDIMRAFTIPASDFYPRPEVVSTVVAVRCRMRAPVRVGDEKGFFELVRMLFSQRRKMVKTVIRRAASGILDEEAIVEILSALKLDKTVRPERLGLEQLAGLYNRISKAGYRFT